MTLQELKYVVALAETGHFGQAAERCHVSQSTLSIGLKKLEDTLGVQLFDRSLKHVTPTGHGREIVAAARRILDETRRIEALARRSEDPMDRSLHFGVIPTLGPYYMPHVLALVHRLYPRLRLLLREEMTPQLLAHLADGRLDAGLLALPVDDAGLQVAPLFVEPFVAAVPSSHALAGAAEVGVEQLAGAGLLLLEEGHCLREQAMEACKMAGLRNEEIRATSLETLRQMVGMGLGVTLLPALAGGSPEGVGQLLAVKPLAAPGAARTIGLVWRRQSPLADTVAQLVATLRAHRPAATRPAAD